MSSTRSTRTILSLRLRAFLIRVGLIKGFLVTDQEVHLTNVIRDGEVVSKMWTAFLPNGKLFSVDSSCVDKDKAQRFYEQLYLKKIIEVSKYL